MISNSLVILFPYNKKGRIYPHPSHKNRRIRPKIHLIRPFPSMLGPLEYSIVHFNWIMYFKTSLTPPLLTQSKPHQKYNTWSLLIFSIWSWSISSLLSRPIPVKIKLLSPSKEATSDRIWRTGKQNTAKIT